MTACAVSVLLFGISALASLCLWWVERLVCKQAVRKLARLEYELEVAERELEQRYGRYRS